MYSSLSGRVAASRFSCLPRETYSIPWFHSGYDVEIFNVIFSKYNYVINVNVDLEIKIHTIYITLILIVD
jgi:hypothetical protein